MARVQKIKERTKKKVVIIIVEGQSDETALSVALSELYEEKYGEDTIILFAKKSNNNGTKGGDITSEHGVVPEKIEMVLNCTTIIPCIKENNLMPKYITEIVHIIDTDGAFIPDEAVTYRECEDESHHHLYMESGIQTDDVISIIDRNHRKRENLLRLLSYHQAGFPIVNYIDTEHGKKPTTKSIVVPYSLYYFSCNLDHFTADDPNLESYLKVLRADEFGRKFGNDLESFKKYICQDSDRVDMDYGGSWEYIQKGINSLHRHTNLNLLFSCVN